MTRKPGSVGAFSKHPEVVTYARHVNPSFIKLLNVWGYGRVFERAEDVWVWDHQGNRYLDFLAAFGAANLGHNHPRLVARLEAFLSEGAMQFNHVGPSLHTARLAERMAGLLPDPLDVSLMSNTGGEAVEAALKLARAATRRAGFVYCEGSYHGTTLGTLSIMGAERMRAPFEPLLGGCVQVPFGDTGALDRALRKLRPAAFVVEPLLGEGGIVLPPPGYLAEAARLCRRRGALLVVDEVQTGLGRTGSMFAFEAERVVPDVLVLAKSLGGGVVPAGQTITSAEIFSRAYGPTDRFDLHSTTFGGNALACTAALETLDILADEGLVERSRQLGTRLLEGLRRRLEGHPFVRDIRGRGLLVAVELGPTRSGWLSRLAPGLVSLTSKNVFGQWAALKMLEAGIICQPASQSWNVLRLEPPLTVGAEEVDRAVAALGDILDEYRSLPRLLKDVAARTGDQLTRGWSS